MIRPRRLRLHIRVKDRERHLSHCVSDPLTEEVANLGGLAGLWTPPPEANLRAPSISVGADGQGERDDLEPRS